MYIYNTATKSKEHFVPIQAGKASIYVCGPTVYDHAHLGHAKSALSFDLLRRVLMHSGFEVTFVRNITDIDDKIIAKLQEEHKTLQELTHFYTKRYHEEMELLSIMPPDIEPKATQSIKSIEHFIQTLIDKGYAYISEDKTVYFQSSKDSKYFSLSKRHVDENETQSRLESQHGKRHPNDFALWKPKKEQEPIAFESAFGAGRPGWHIECSAMIEEVFGHDKAYSIDIHAGGADLLFPHHENEAAQSRCANGVELAKYWVHNGFVNINGEKMSKSLGNSFFLKDALKAYHPQLIRFYLLSSHYRAHFNFSETDLIQIKKRLDRIYRLKKRLYGMKASELKTSFQEQLLEALQDDLNSSKALALIDEMISLYNEKLDADPKDKSAKKEALANLAYIESIMGIGSSDAYDYFQFGVDEASKKEIESKIQERTQAKKEKDFAHADRIREELIARGVMIMDTPEGTKWEMR